MLEILVIQAHLKGLADLPPGLLQSPLESSIGDFVRDLFTIRRIGAFRESSLFRPVRSIGAEHAGAASGRGGQARRRRRRRRGGGARHFARRRGARRARRGIRTLGRRRCRTARAGRTAPGGGLDQRYQRRWRRKTRRARGGDGAGRARRQICRPRRSVVAGARFPDLDLLDARVPSTSELERRACEAEAAALAVKGVDQIRRRVGLDRHRRHGAGDLDRLPRLLLALEPGHLDDRDLRRRHRHGARLRLHLGAARLRSRLARKRRPQGRRAHGGARQSAQGRDLQGACGVRSPGFRLAGRPSRRRRQRRLDRAQDQLPEGSPRPATVRARTSASSTIPCGCAACARRRSTPRASR